MLISYERVATPEKREVYLYHDIGQGIRTVESDRVMEVARRWSRGRRRYRSELRMSADFVVVSRKKWKGSKAVVRKDECGQWWLSQA